MNGELMGDIWENSPAKGAELILLLTIAYFADDEGFASETASTLGERARMSTDSVYRATARLEEKGLLKVIQRGEGRAPSQFQLPRSGRTLRPQSDVFELRGRSLRLQEDCVCGRNLRPQDDDPASWPQSAATSDDASGRNLRPQNGSSPQSAASTDAPTEGTRAGADARVGGLEGTTPPTNPPTDADRARASAEPIDDDAFEFMASLDLKRTPGIKEQREISGLYTAKIAAGFTDAEIRNSVGGDWEGARNRVRTLIWRFKQMPDYPLRRPATQRATSAVTPWECTDCGDPVWGAPTAGALCPRCWGDADERAQDKLGALDAAFRTALLDEAKERLTAKGWRPTAVAQHVLAAELMHADDVAARAAQVLAEWDRKRDRAEHNREGSR